MKQHCKPACGWCVPRNSKQQDALAAEQQGSAASKSVGHPEATADGGEGAQAVGHHGHQGSETKMRAQLAALQKVREAARQMQGKLQAARAAELQVSGGRALCMASLMMLCLADVAPVSG